jgi:putative FmdB family regulatory protein
MPIYAYRCQACGHELDALQKISDAPLTDCPECGAPELKKQLTAAAFRLKGSGWYETDFKKDGKKNLHETGDKDTKKETKASEGAAPKSDQGGKTPKKAAAATKPKAAASKPAAGAN